MVYSYAVKKENSIMLYEDIRPEVLAQWNMELDRAIACASAILDDEGFAVGAVLASLCAPPSVTWQVSWETAAGAKVRRVYDEFPLDKPKGAKVTPILAFGDGKEEVSLAEALDKQAQVIAALAAAKAKALDTALPTFRAKVLATSGSRNEDPVTHEEAAAAAYLYNYWQRLQGEAGLQAKVVNAVISVPAKGKKRLQGMLVEQPSGEWIYHGGTYAVCSILEVDPRNLPDNLRPSRVTEALLNLASENGFDIVTEVTPVRQRNGIVAYNRFTIG